MPSIDTQQVRGPQSRISHLLSRPMVGPLGVGAAAMGALAVIAVRNPYAPNSYPTCPFHAMTGLDCPGCGATRGLYELVHGNVIGMADCNILLAFAVPFLLWRYVRWTGVRSGRVKPAQTLARPEWLVALAIAVIVFWIVRNLPGVGFLPAGLG